MKKTYIGIIVLVLAVLGLWFFIAKGNKVEAPATIANDQIMQGMEEVPMPNNNAPVAPVTAAPTVDKSGVKEFTISGQNFSFTPNVINVNKGDKVRIIFQNVSGFHDLKIDEFGVATKKMQSPYQEIVEFTASKAGSFVYYCSIGTHRAMGMWGTLNVE